MSLFPDIETTKDRRYLDLPVSSHISPKSVFSYYGGKSKIAHRYPEPKHDLIVEPFGGAGAYAWRHRNNHQVWINDLDPITISIWNFLQSPDSLEEITDLCLSHETLTPGSLISEVAAGAAPGLVALLHAELGRGFQGRTATQDRITAWGAGYYWPRLLMKYQVVIPAVKDWIITNLSYEEMVIEEPATYFIDPPYNNAAGKRYRHHDVDYSHLAGWCKTRIGQTIVCENEGATWLPFRTLTTKAVGMGQSNPNSIGEVMYYHEALQAPSVGGAACYDCH